MAIQRRNDKTVDILSADFARLGHNHAFGTVTLDNLSDVVITAAALGDYLRFDGTNWVDVAIAQLATDLAATFQALDATLTALAAYNTNGFLVQTAADTFVGRTLTGSSHIAVSFGDGVSGNPSISITDGELLALAGLVSAADRLPYFTDVTTASLAVFTAFARTLLDDADAAAARATLELVIGTNVQAWDADLDALAALASTAGMLSRTGAGAFAVRTLTAPAAGITISNPTGSGGNPTFALANDLSALEGLASTGFAARTATDTWAQRTLTEPAAGLTISNPAGIAGNPTFALANDLAALEGLGSTGIAARTATDTWAQRTITGTTDRITVTNGNGVSGNPTIDLVGATWTDWTPVVTQGIVPTITISWAKYSTIGKIAFLSVNVLITSSATSGQIIKISGLPAAVQPIRTGGTAVIGTADIQDAGTAQYVGALIAVGADDLRVFSDGQNGYVGANPSFQLVNTDRITFNAMYEIA